MCSNARASRCSVQDEYMCICSMYTYPGTAPPPPLVTYREIHPCCVKLALADYDYSRVTCTIYLFIYLLGYFFSKFFSPFTICPTPTICSTVCEEDMRYYLSLPMVPGTLREEGLGHSWTRENTCPSSPRQAHRQNRSARTPTIDTCPMPTNMHRIHTHQNHQSTLSLFPATSPAHNVIVYSDRIDIPRRYDKSVTQLDLPHR
ncbi:hypothetical protein K504DRAFT_30303 [Pleomassaria siparia CBS 279.74]|uniref:Uncharacterized protein n=1 Tax=Pleomassaria siparia CBS 279.74 TaxID=1314801 RepID=A0A6G1KRZ9_9PLEO|nr:hypothetical protein K504DRAFT_30303 [Pleomassaria siparia CBS 279.74]